MSSEAFGLNIVAEVVHACNFKKPKLMHLQLYLNFKFAGIFPLIICCGLSSVGFVVACVAAAFAAGVASFF